MKDVETHPFASRSSGERVWRHLGPLLTPISWPYAAAVVARRRWWQSRARSLECPVVSVGNLTCGGTGKTPTVQMMVGDLKRLGFQPAILSRGYGSSGAVGGNDEYEVLAANLPDVPHYQGADRWACGRQAIDRGADILILDDGFQHVQLRKDLDFVLLDALDPFGNGRLLPAGTLRESIGALRHADLVGITRTDLQAEDRVDELSASLAKRFPRLAQVRLRTETLDWRSLDDDTHGADAFRGRSVAAFCGIGNPDAFRRQLTLLGAEVRLWIPFADHHRYTSREIREVSERARECQVAAVVMTQKDVVKLRAPEFRVAMQGPPWLFLRIVQNIVAGEGAYREALAGLRHDP